MLGLPRDMPPPPPCSNLPLSFLKSDLLSRRRQEALNLFALYSLTPFCTASAACISPPAQRRSYATGSIILSPISSRVESPGCFLPIRLFPQLVSRFGIGCPPIQGKLLVPSVVWIGRPTISLTSLREFPYFFFFFRISVRSPFHSRRLTNPITIVVRGSSLLFPIQRKCLRNNREPPVILALDWLTLVESPRHSPWTIFPCHLPFLFEANSAARLHMVPPTPFCGLESTFSKGGPEMVGLLTDSLSANGGWIHAVFPSLTPLSFFPLRAMLRNFSGHTHETALVPAPFNCSFLGYKRGGRIPPSPSAQWPPWMLI